MSEWWIDSSPPAGPFPTRLEAKLVFHKAEVLTQAQFGIRHEITVSPDLTRYKADFDLAEEKPFVTVYVSGVEFGEIESISGTTFASYDQNMARKEIPCWLICTRREPRLDGLVDRYRAAGPVIQSD